MKVMRKKNITVEDLATMVKKGFDETAKSRDMNARFKDAGKRFDKIEKN